MSLLVAKCLIFAWMHWQHMDDSLWSEWFLRLNFLSSFFPMGFLLNSLVYFMPWFFFSFYQHHLQFLYHLCEKELISCCINWRIDLRFLPWGLNFGEQEKLHLREMTIDFKLSLATRYWGLTNQTSPQPQHSLSPLDKVIGVRNKGFSTRVEVHG